MNFDRTDNRKDIDTINEEFITGTVLGLLKVLKPSIIVAKFTDSFNKNIEYEDTLSVDEKIQLEMLDIFLNSDRDILVLEVYYKLMREQWLMSKQV